MRVSVNKIFALLLFFYCALPISLIAKEVAQNPSISKQRKQDSLKVINLMILGEQMTFINLDSAKLVYSQALVVSKNNRFGTQVADINIKLGKVSFKKGEYSNAIRYFQEALKSAQELKDQKRQAEAYHQIGRGYIKKNLLRGAEQYFKKSLQMSKLARDQNCRAESLNALAALYLIQKKIPQALSNARLAFTVASASDNYDQVVVSYKNLGDIAKARGKFKSAISYYNRQSQTQNLSAEKKNIALKDSIIAILNNKNTEITKIISHEESVRQKAISEKNAIINEITQQANEKLVDVKGRFNILLGAFLIITLLLVLTIFYIVWEKYFVKKNSQILLQQELNLREQEYQELYEEKYDLVNIVAHDMKSPLDRVKGLVTIMQMEKEDVVKQKEYLELIDTSIESLRNLISKTLNLRELDQSEIKPEKKIFDITDLSLLMYEQFRERADIKHIKLLKNIVGAPCYVNADINYMTQVMENLISNALKFSPTHRKVTIQLTKNTHDVTFSVIDEGPGIREEDKPKLFRKFTKLAARPTGNEDSTGLGLSLVKKYVESMGGIVGCNSTFGKGATFFATFKVVKSTDSDNQPLKSEASI